jgi:deoxyribonuclease V
MLPLVMPTWPRTPAEAIALQRDLAARVRCQDDLGPIRTVAGVDVSTNRFSDVGYAAIAVLQLPDWRVIEVAEARVDLPMPYIPGLLSFRELPAVLAAYRTLSAEPDLLMVDGHGRAHPRRCGIASHLGIVLDRPTIGCAKSLLVGQYDPPGPEVGEQAALCDRGEEIGRVVRTKRRTNPLFVSCGHRVSLETAVHWVLEGARGYRLPEPTRQAHLASNALRRRWLAGVAE